mgnify:CR=1 FL=1
MDYNEQASLSYPVNINELLKVAVKEEASDLNMVAGFPPAVRVNGSIKALNYPPLRPKDMESLLLPLLTELQLENLKRKLELDFSYVIEGVARFRGNIMFQRGIYAAAFRGVPFVIPEFEKLGLIPEIKKLCELSKGLVLVTGPAGSGKSTTLAALVDILNRTRELNIVTIEDPIEFLHKHKKSIVKQREIGIDTRSFANALRHVLRHDPDVIMIGEMRDLESISIALTAAETGHLVLSTLHTQTAPTTISRIIDAFTEEKRELVRLQLANTLQAVISQQLIPAIDGPGMVVAVEYMVNTNAIRKMIREKKNTWFTVLFKWDRLMVCRQWIRHWLNCIIIARFQGSMCWNIVLTSRKLKGYCVSLQ